MLQPVVPVPHWFGVPAPPQVCGEVQVPQLIAPPQPSPTSPQFALAAWQLRGVQLVPGPHWFGPAAPQVCPLGHGPQLSRPPQRSAMFPHCAIAALQLVGMHESPQRLGPLPPHTPPFGQVPQLIAPPQPSLTQPHDRPSQACCNVMGVHIGRPHTFGAPPPPHVSGCVHVPQLTVPPQPSPTKPQFFIGMAMLHAAVWVSGVQLFSPQVLGPPPPQYPLVQTPQLYVPPQPSLTTPHELLGHAVFCGMRTQPPQMPGLLKPQT